MHNLDKVDLLKSDLNKLKPINFTYQKRIDEKFRLEFNYNSNHLEGNTLTYGETKLLLIFGDTQGSHQKREFDEMEAHDVAFNIVREWANDTERPLSENQIKELNEIILVKPFWKDAITNEGQQTRRQIKIGNYKEFPNSVILSNGEIFDYALPSETPRLMGELIDWYRHEEYVLNPVTLAAMLHYKFVRIHPFDDGNGRIARLLLNYVLLKFGFPPVVIKSSDKQNYLRALHIADLGDYTAFINYISEQLIWSLELSIKGARGESIEEQGDWEKQLEVLKKNYNYDKIKIRQRNSFAVFNEIYQRTIIPFVNLWQNKISKFDDLFEEKIVKIHIETDNGHITETGDNLLFFFDKVFQDSISKLGLIYEEIRFSVEFKNLKKSNISKNFSGGLIEFQFDEYSYEIDTLNTYSFIYGDYLSNEQIENIIDSFGKNLLKEINNQII
ncbi:Fic family protein [Chryseobacterium sp. PBS4-4]|uniref:Fic family protein n=1 Tax=Chryseobacterium edaphi TaxID=2976532 RepID=A0ABT2W455_9FLAO|nr:Fic family protein [Chryseobacterium edaphi]MCU7616990.1 Fic family protein [Chryseobacterium edaphi]